MPAMATTQLNFQDAPTSLSSQANTKDNLDGPRRESHTRSRPLREAQRRRSSGLEGPYDAR